MVLPFLTLLCRYDSLRYFNSIPNFAAASIQKDHTRTRTPTNKRTYARTLIDFPLLVMREHGIRDGAREGRLLPSLLLLLLLMLLLLLLLLLLWCRPARRHDAGLLDAVDLVDVRDGEELIPRQLPDLLCSLVTPFKGGWRVEGGESKPSDGTLPRVIRPCVLVLALRKVTTSTGQAELASALSMWYSASSMAAFCATSSSILHARVCVCVHGAV